MLATPAKECADQRETRKWRKTRRLLVREQGNRRGGRAKLDDLEVSKEESEEVKGGWKRVKPESPQPHL
jgi:hypothetical protein